MNMEQYKYLPLEYGSIREPLCNIHKSQGTLPATRMHYHDFYQVYYLTKGRLCHRSEKEERMLYSGDCFIIPPNFPHSITKVEEEPEFYSFSFRRDLLPDSTVSTPLVSGLMELLRPESIKLGLTMGRRELYGLEQLFALALREFEGQRVGWECAVQGILSTILVTLARAYGEEGGQILPQSQIQACIRYIDQHFQEDLQVGDFLERFHFSPSGFYRAFLDASGQSFSSYLLERRIEYACFLMGAQDRSLAQIARLSGSWDYSSFYRSFKKRMGVGPGEYRRGLLGLRKKT